MDALHRLAAAGVPVLNPAGRRRGGGRQVPRPGPARRRGPARARRPGSGESADEALAAFEALGGDVVVKPLFGSEGRGLVRVTDPELGPADVPRPWNGSGRCSTSSGRSAIRATTSGSSSSGTACSGRSAVTPPAGDWRTNVAVGGRAEAVPARRPRPSGWPSAPPRAVGAEMAGVDLLPDLDGDGWSSWKSTPSPAGGPSRPRRGSTSPPRSSADLQGRSTMTRAAPSRPASSRRSPACWRSRRGSRGTSTGSAISTTPHYLDFVLSASAIAAPLDRRPDLGRRRGGPGGGRGDPARGRDRTRTSA